MKEQLEQQLQADFPFMKQNRIEGEQNIYRRFGCECSAGWYGLIHDMCQAIANRYVLEKVPVDFVPLQIKEKFSVLRIYFAYEGEPIHIAALDCLGGTSIRFVPGMDTQDEKKKKLRQDIAQIVHAYEEKSKSVCEFCGDEKSATARMDMARKRTLCNTCYENYLEKQSEKKDYRKQDFL